MNRELRKVKNLSDKHLMMFLLMNEWVKVKQQNKSLAMSIIDKGYSTVAIYGMSYIGQRLVDELFESDVRIVSCLDKNSGGKYMDFTTVGTDRIPIGVDLIIVTPIFYFDEIREELKKKTEAEIVSVEELIYGLSNSE